MSKQILSLTGRVARVLLSNNLQSNRIIVSRVSAFFCDLISAVLLCREQIDRHPDSMTFELLLLKIFFIVLLLIVKLLMWGRKDYHIVQLSERDPPAD